MRLLTLLLLTTMLIGCSIVQAQEPLPPKPTVDSQPSMLVDRVAITTATTTPTPTPTHPVEIACTNFTTLVHYSWWAMVDDESSKIMTSKTTQGWILQIKNGVADYPLYARAATAMLNSTFPNTVNPNRFQEGLLGARQFDRLCGYEGYKRPIVFPDVLIEHICSLRVASSTWKPIFGTGFGTC